MLPHLTKFKGAALDFLFPQKCLGCGKEGELLCTKCQNNLPRIIPPVCPKCGKPQPSGILCPGCVTWKSSIAGIRSPLKFEGLVREAVHQLKYKNLTSLAGPLALILKDYLIHYPVPGDVLVPVPLHPRRLKERGYNQSLLLAQNLSRLLNIPVAGDCLVRTRFTTPQAKTTSVDERLQNVKHAFSCSNSNLQNQKVILIDDVSTSGATLNACAVTLIQAGSASVWGIVLSREL